LLEEEEVITQMAGVVVQVDFGLELLSLLALRLQ
jgi:hypothetical protein